MWDPYEDWLELDRSLFESASIHEQTRVLGLLDELFLGLSILANASPPLLLESDFEAVRLFIVMFSAGRVPSSWSHADHAGRLG